MLRRVLSSGAIRGALTFGLGGLGFAVGNVMLAGLLPPEQFGLVSLVMALIQFGLSCGPLGLDVVVKRHKPRASAGLVRAAVRNSVLVAAAVALFATPFYGLGLVPGLLLLAGAALASANSIGFSLLQGRGDVNWALGLAQSPNYVLLALALMVAALDLTHGLPVLIGVVLGYAVATTISWLRAGRNQGHLPELDARLALREGAASVSIGLALQLLWQLERVAIPKLLSINDLATFAVLAAVVSAPFRMTQIGVAFTLIEKLRSATNRRAARSVLGHEILIGLVLTVGAVIGVLVLKPLVFHYLLDNKYVIGPSLMVVTLAVGVVRVAEGFSTTVVTALGTATDLTRISILSWLGLVLAIVAAIPLSRFGLEGIVGAALLGWGTLFTGGSLLAARTFRRRFTE